MSRSEYRFKIKIESGELAERRWARSRAHHSSFAVATPNRRVASSDTKDNLPTTAEQKNNLFIKITNRN